MSTNIIIWIVAAIVVLGGGTYAVTHMKSTANTEADTATTTDTTANGSLTLKALLASGLPQKCEFTDTTAAAATSGTVYVSGGNARGDFAATASGQTYHAHTIITSDTMYSWVDETKMGMKMAITESADASTSSSFDANKALDYHCTPWIPDSSKFTVPTTITFTAVNMGGSGSAGAGTSGSATVNANVNASVQASACAQCEMVPEAYRAQCKVAAGC